MKYFCSLIIIISLCSSLFSQTLNVELEKVDSVVTWPWNWDIVSDGDRLITVNEIGTLNIREDGVWQNIEIDPDNNQLEPRSVDVDSEGNIWIATLENGLWRYSIDGEFTNFNTSNSSLPTDKLRILDVFENYIWVSTSDSEGLIRYDMISQESILFNMDNTDQLKTNGILDPYVDLEGNVWIDNRECLSIISTDLTWTSFDFRTLAPGALINDIDFISTEVTLISADKAIVKSENGSYDRFTDDDRYNYEAYHLDSSGNQWTYYSDFPNEFLRVERDGSIYEFNADTIEAIPSEVFKMIEHQDTIMMVGLLGNQIAKFSIDFISSNVAQEKPSIELFPNPAHNYINIQATEKQNYDYAIYNLNGQKIDAGTTRDNRISLHNLTSGAYILEVLSMETSQKHKERITVLR